MSLQATAWASSRAPNSKGAARALLLILADMANGRDGHTCDPKIETLANRAGVSTRTIKRQLTQLELVGDITIAVGGGRGNSSVYTFHHVAGKGVNNVTFYEPEKVTVLVEKGDSFGNLSIYEPVLTVVEEEEDDLAAPLRAELARIVNRTLTDGERATIDDNSITPEERRRMVKALSKLSARWSTIEARHDCAKWLKRTFDNVVDEREEVAHRRRKYVPDEPSAPLDELRLEHAIEPEPLPPPAPKQPHEELWEDTLSDLRLVLPAGTFSTWLQYTKAAKAHGDVLTVHVPTKEAKQMCESRLQRKIELSLRAKAGRSVGVAFEVAQ